LERALKWVALGFAGLILIRMVADSETSTTTGPKKISDLDGITCLSHETKYGRCPSNAYFGKTMAEAQAAKKADAAERRSKRVRAAAAASAEAELEAETAASPWIAATDALQETLNDRYPEGDSFCEVRVDDSRKHFQCIITSEAGVLDAVFVTCARPITTETSSCTMRSMTFAERCETGEISGETDEEIVRCRELGYEYAG